MIDTASALIFGAILLALAAAGYKWGRWRAVFWLGAAPWAALSIGADLAWWSGLWDRSEEYEPLPASMFVLPIWIPFACVAVALAVLVRRRTRGGPEAAPDVRRRGRRRAQRL